MVHIEPQRITVIHHMLESHLCPFWTTEAPCGFSRIKLQNPIQGHAKITVSIQSSIHCLLHLVSLQSAAFFLALYHLSANSLPCFPHRFLNRGFWARGRLYTVSIGEKIKRSCSPSWKKIEAGGELNCMSRDLGWDDKAAAGKWSTWSTLQPHWLDCTHTNWILKKPRDPSPTRPEAVYSGFREVSNKGGGWVEVMNRGVTFHPDPRLLLLRYCCSCLPVLQGGFSSLSALGGVAHRRLGESIFTRFSSGRVKKSTGGRALIFQKQYGVDPICHLWLYSPERRTFVDYTTLISFIFLYDRLHFCEGMYLFYTCVLKFARAVGIFGGVAFVISSLFDEKTRNYKADLETWNRLPLILTSCVL